MGQTWGMPIPAEALEKYAKFARRYADPATMDAEKGICQRRLAELEKEHPGIGQAYARSQQAEEAAHEQKVHRGEKRAEAWKDPVAARQRFRDAVKAATKPTPNATLGQSVLDGLLGWAAGKAAERVEKAFAEAAPEILDEFAEQINQAAGEKSMGKRRGSNKRNPEISIDDRLNEWEEEGGIDVEVVVDDSTPDDVVVESADITMKIEGELLLALQDDPKAFGEYILECIAEAVEDALGDEDSEEVDSDDE